MKPKHFLSRLDNERIVAAIADAETRTSGEIRVWISSQARPDPLATAQARFGTLGMTRTRHRNAVLIFVAPRSRTLAVVGDSGIHGKCAPGFWQHVRDAMSAHLREGRYTEGVLQAIEIVGAELARHFPTDLTISPGERLPDDPIED